MRFQAIALGLMLAAPAWSGVIGDERGKRHDALAPCDAAWDVGRRADARRCYSGLIQSGDMAVRAEAWWALGDVKQANDVFRAAVAAEPQNPDLRVRWGYLYLQTHNPGEAANLFNEALGIDEGHVAAKLGVASVMAGRFDEKVSALVDEALKARPDQTLGYLLRARVALEDGRPDDADEQLDKALKIAEQHGLSPQEAYSLKAAADMLRGKLDSPWIDKALEHDPLYGQVYAEIAHYYVITRRYREAIEMYQKAVDVDVELWSAHADLGVNLMRENREEEGRRHLEIAYEADPFSAKTVNSLRLSDSFDQFKLFSNKDLLLLEGEQAAVEALGKPEVIVRLHNKESAVLRPYVLDLAERSVDVFSKKYKFKPERPIHVELYPDHDDFAVRTMGMPGVGLLGVTFGYLVAMDSPSGREAGKYHWGTTLWHEMAHVFTLEKTNHLVPRWFSEGISMYEEWEARPNWGERITPDFVQAFNDEKLLPVADLDKGFMRPSYPNQIVVSYFQAGLVCQMIDRQWGPEKLTAMLELFAADATTADTIRQALEIEPEEFDERFQEFIKKRLGPLAGDGLKAWRAKMKDLLTAAGKEDWDAVIERAPQVEELYPDYVDSGNPYTLAARAYEEKGEREQAVAKLETYFKRGGRNPSALKELAGRLQEAGRRQDAIDVREEMLWINPLDEELHRDLGDDLLAEGRLPEAAREFQALLAMEPLDKAAANFRLAETYHKMKDPKRTRRHLLLALEAAPSYKPAQKLLLEITNK